MILHLFHYLVYSNINGRNFPMCLLGPDDYNIPSYNYVSSIQPGYLFK